MADYPPDLILHSLLRQAGMNSWQQLATTSGISVYRLRKLRQGNIDCWQIGEFQKLSKALNISLSSLLISLKLLPPEQTIIDFQLMSFQTIESFLTYWPVAAQQAQLDPTFAASKLLPLVGSIDRLVASWGITAIGVVGETLSFNPQIHQSLAGSIQTGTAVQIRYPGYCQGNRLLTRAKVSPNS